MELYRKIQDKYGIEAMRRVWIEELIELALVLQQDTRKDKDIHKSAILKEVADVEIILDQMRVLFLTESENENIDSIKSNVLEMLPSKLNL